MGSIQVAKALSGYHGSQSFESFLATYTVTDMVGRPIASQTLSYTDDFGGASSKTITFDNLPAGKYTVTESISSDAYDKDHYSIANTAEPESGIGRACRCDVHKHLYAGEEQSRKDIYS